MNIECDESGCSVSELEFTVYRCPMEGCYDPSLAVSVVDDE